MKITNAALRRLQVLYKQFEAHSLDAGASRADRLAWASTSIKRRIASFSDLSVEEGIQLIDGLQRIVGNKVPSKTPRRVRPVDRYSAQKAGTEGRHDQIHAEVTIASPSDLTLIQQQMTRLGWDTTRLEAFLRSSKSPLKGRMEIRTLGDVNKLYWSLKNISARKEQLAAS
jgi:hypothetical protein